MKIYKRHREFEVYLTTYDGAQHLRLHGWLKKHDVIIKSETFQNTKTIFGTFMVYINDIMLAKLKEENHERGLFYDIEVMNTESERWNVIKNLSKKESENILEKLQYDGGFIFRERFGSMQYIHIPDSISTITTLTKDDIANISISNSSLFFNRLIAVLYPPVPNVAALVAKETP